MAMAHPMLQVEGLRKAYGEVEALRGVDMAIAPGEIVSLLGPNGAGKTTLVSIVAGLRKADAGTVRVDGLDALHHTVEVRRRIGLAPQDMGIYPVVSVRNNFQLFGRLAGLHKRELERRIEEVAAALTITELLDRQAGSLSGGQKRRVHTAIALLHRPPLLLLDEATTGADVETRQHILTLVRQIAEEGSAVLYSTHYLQEVETLGATVALLDAGRVIARGPVQEVIHTHAAPVVDLTFDGEVPALTIEGEAIVEGNTLRIGTSDPAGTITQVIPQIPPESLASIQIVRPDLESVYLALTGRRYEEADQEGERVAEE